MKKYIVILTAVVLIAICTAIITTPKTPPISATIINQTGSKIMIVVDDGSKAYLESGETREIKFAGQHSLQYFRVTEGGLSFYYEEKNFPPHDGARVRLL